jgi:drug/metabolite transporter (DMT)-like permease
VTTTALLLVLASTVTHAWWNFLIKRASGGTVFIGLSKVVELVLFAPVFLVWSVPRGGFSSGTPALVGVAAVLALGNYVALSKAYEHGDLSVVYPVARGGTLLFLPLFGFLMFGEHISPLGWIAIACIIAGILGVRLREFSTRSLSELGRQLWSPAIAFALLASITTAGYTVWDKRSVTLMPTFTYFYAYTAVVAIVYMLWMMRSHAMGELRSEWHSHRGAIVQVGFFNTTSYLLVLVALQGGTSSYVLALRQLSIALGVLLGWRVLRETMPAPKVVGVMLIVAGCALVAFAR